jgi:hypothetical protein
MNEIPDECASLRRLKMGLWKYDYLAPGEPMKRPVFTYALLGFTLLLLGANIYRWINLPVNYQGDRYGNVVVGLGLLFGQLAFNFRWPVLPTVLLRMLAFAWTLFACVYFVF